VRVSGEVVAGRYEIEERIAVGGMGAVYRARHLLSRRGVAIKLLHPHLAMDVAAAERFRREARAAADIGHPGIVEVLDAGREEATGSLFLVMELLEGESLRDRLLHPEITRGEALALIDALLDPLAAAHERGFVHRDLKPENVFVEREGRVKLLDFGIAKDLGTEGATLTGVALGTPHYMPPEQIMSSKGATPASDVWAIGAMIYEIVAGAPPFTGPTPHAVVVRACASPHAPLREVGIDVGPRLATLVDRALEKGPRDRFQNARELRDALRAALSADPDASRAPVTMRPHAAPVDPSNDTIPSVRPAASTGGTSWQRVEREGLSVALPPGWALRESSVPNVVALVIDTATEHDDVPTQIRFKRDEWPGDTRSYAELGIEGIARIGRLHRTTESVLADLPAVEVDATYDVDRPCRTLTRCAARAGVGWVAQASASPERFQGEAAVFRAILGTLRLAS